MNVDPSMQDRGGTQNSLHGKRRSAPSPQVSVVVCTRNRDQYLPDALRSYEEMKTELQWELVVVNNGSTDSTEDILRHFATESTIAVQVRSEPKPGLSAARNCGWQCAKSEIVAFSDDDCYPQADFVDAIWQTISTDQLDYVGGRVLLYDPADLPVTIQLRESRLDLPPGTYVESGLVHGANMAFRRSVLAAVGGFDEFFGRGVLVCDDTDLISRASAAGFRGAYDPRPVVFHHHRRRDADQLGALMRSYDIGRGAHYMKSVLDPIRRRQASRQWYWRTFLPSIRSGSAARKLCYESLGAFLYLVSRFRR